MIVGCRPPPLRRRSFPRAKPSTRASPGICRRSFPTGTRGKRGYRELDQRHRRVPAVRGHAGQGPDRLLARLREQDALGQLAYKVWYFASLQLRPGSARQHRQRPAPASAAAASRGGGRRRRGSTPNCCASRSTRSAQWMDAVAGAGASIASSSRICSGSRSTCSTRPASGCCRCRAGLAACRTTRTRRCRRPTRGFRRSRCRRRVGPGELRPVSQAARHVPAAGGSPRGLRGALRHLCRHRSTPTPRSTTA